MTKKICIGLSIVLLLSLFCFTPMFARNVEYKPLPPPPTEPGGGGNPYCTVLAHCHYTMPNGEPGTYKIGCYGVGTNCSKGSSWVCCDGVLISCNY